MQLKSVKEIKKLKGKRVLLRVDFNIDLGANHRVDKSEDWRLRKSLPTIKYLLKKKAKIILVAHLGQPGGKTAPSLRLSPIVDYFEKLLGRKILHVHHSFAKEAIALAHTLSVGKILLLENIRFEKGEEQNSRALAKKLASYADVYVNDAFGVSHRSHASISRITEYLPSYAGLLLQKEVETLSRVLKNPHKPLAIIIGGAKIETKVGAIKNLMKKADYILLAGTIANTILQAQGVSVGRSIVDKATAKWLKKIKLTSKKFKLPLDAVLAKQAKQSSSSRLAAIGQVKEDEIIMDIGPETLKLFKSVVDKSKMIVWNGPMGMFEIKKFSHGTKELAKIVAGAKGESIVGGGSTIEAIRELHLDHQFDFISTGGGAMLEFLEGKMLPGIKPLIKL